MRRAQILISLSVMTLLSGLLGCDVAVVAILATRNNKKSNNPSTPPAPDLSYTLYVANFASPSAASTEAGNLDTNGGNPSNTVWQFVGNATQTQIWSGLPPGMNAVLIQGPLTQVYNIDTFERLDANDAVVEVPTSANVYANSAISGSTPKANASGMLDGIPVTTSIADPAHIPCVFALFTQTLSSVRVRLWGASQAPGDCVWSGHQELANSIVVGRAAADSSGNVYTTYLDPSASPAQSWLLPFQANGSKGTLFNVSSSASSSGGISVAVDSSGNLFMASNSSSGAIQVQKYAGGATPAQWSYPYTGVAAGGTNLIGNHGLAVASNVPLISASSSGTAVFVAAGQGTVGSHTEARLDDTPNTTPPPPFAASLVWGPSTIGDSASKSTTWSGVAVSGSSDVLTTGNLTNSGTGNIEVITEDRALANGTVGWPTALPLPTTGGGTSTNNGNAIGADNQGFAYVAGFFGSAANGRDSVLLRYKVADGSGLTTLYQNGVSSGSFAFGGANEFMDVAVDTDGTTYVVGYITQSNLVSTTATPPVTSWWVGKFSPAGLVPVWTATFNFGVGNDQALSVSISGNFLYVVGSETFTGPKTGLRVLRFVK